MIGQLVSHYLITEKIGEGGMGVVYKAKDEELGRFVAIKRLPPELVGDDERRGRFLHEARTVSALNHPNIVTVHDLVRDVSGESMVMEFVEGRTLDRLIPRGGLPLGETLALGEQIVDALSAAHGAGIIHRDLKPGNVMVTPNGRVKVLDFGLAKLTEAAPLADDKTRPASPVSHEGAVVGTLSYMSPEQAVGKPLDARSDVFSFGLLLYEMLTGERAFRGSSGAETLASIIRDEPKPLSEVSKDIPPEIERLVRRCLRKDAAKRWQTMADLKLTIEELRAESESGRLSGVRVAELRPALKRGVWAAVAAGVLVFATGTGWWVTRGREPAKTATYAPVPLTTDPGFETQVSFSPDGNQIAYMARPENSDNYDVYVKLVGAGSPLRLTTDPAEDGGPAWSPDGRWIAFSRTMSASERHLLVMPALGGPERRLGVFTTSQSPAWSPDGNWIAVSVCEKDQGCAIGLVPFEGGEVRKLTKPGSARDTVPRFSPDGRTLTFARLYNVRVESVWTLPLTADCQSAGEAKEITDRVANGRPVWAPDGGSILFVHGAAERLSRIARDGGTPEPLTWAGTQVQYPAVSPQANRLAFTRRILQVNAYALPLDPGGNAAGPPKAAFNSTSSEYCPLISPDGKKVAFQSNRTGEHEIWVCDADGGNCQQLTSFKQFAGSPSWSPDGQWLAFDATINGANAAYVIPASGGKPRRLDEESAYVPRWSRDGKSIYVSGLRKAAATGGPYTRVAPRGSVPLESVDGKYLYFTTSVGFVKSPLRRWRVADGVEEEMLPEVAGRNFALTEKGIWFVTPYSKEQPSEIRYMDLATKVTRTVYRLEKPTFAGFDVAPDGKYLLFTQLDEDGADLLLVDGFR